jgi:branched-chain amino acid transport system permease protein
MYYASLIDGFFIGGLYASIALGLTLVFGVMKMVNLAQGEFMIGSAYLAYLVVTHVAIDPYLSLVIIAPVMFGVGYLVQRIILNPLMKRGQETLLVATFGLMMIAEITFALCFGNNSLSLNAPYTLTGITFFGVIVRTINAIALAVAVLMVVGTYLVLTQLRFGKAVRAAAEDPLAAASVGIDVPLIYGLTFGLAAALTAVGGITIGLSYGFAPTNGPEWLLRSFTVVVLGGMGSLWGVLFGGILVGVVEELGARVVGAQYRDLIVFGFLIFILIIRPQGMFGQKVSG